jgi:hypothetical protein
MHVETVESKRKHSQVLQPVHRLTPNLHWKQPQLTIVANFSGFCPLCTMNFSHN